MSPTLAEVTVGLIAATLVFLFAIRITPLIIERLAHFMNRSFNDHAEDEHERTSDDHDR